MNPILLLSTLNLSLGALVFFLGLVILRENPRQRLNRLVALMLFFGGLGAILAATALLASRSGQSPVAAGRAMSDLLGNFSYVWEMFFPTLFLFASVFPQERAFARRLWVLPGRWWTPGFSTLVFAPHVFHFGLLLVISMWQPRFTVPEVGLMQYLAPFMDVGGVILRLFLLVHQSLFSLVNLGFGLATMALLFDSHRHARAPRLKQQLGVIAVGLSACLVCYSLATSIPGLFNFEIPEGLRSGLTVAALTLGPGSIAYAIVRHKFLDTKLLARRGILYALTTAALVGLYLLLAGRVNGFVTQMTGVDARVFEPVFLVIALALFQPAIARLEEMLDQMLLKDPTDYRNVVRQLGRELQTTIDLDVLLTRTIGTLAEALLLKRAIVIALPPEGAIVRTGQGEPPSPAALARLSSLLPRVSTRQTSYRLVDRVEGWSREEQAELVQELGLALLVPLRWRDDLMGALLLGEKLTGTEFTSEDVTLLTTLGAQVSVSLQNALLLRDRVAVARFEEELNLARQIQRTSLLSEFPAIPHCDVHALYVPSKHVGGDFYDVVPSGDGAYLLAIADVSGKGVPAALLSSMLQASLRTQAESGPSVPTILRNINTVLYRSSAIQQFATFFLARIESDRLRLTFSNAGHNWPVLVKRGGGRQLLDRGGTVLGILEETEFEQGQVGLAPGDLVVLYTDGVTEAANAHGEQLGEERLYDLVERLPAGWSAREVVEHLYGRLRDFLGANEPQDDVTLLVLRVLEPVPGARAEGPSPEVAATR